MGAHTFRRSIQETVFITRLAVELEMPDNSLHTRRLLFAFFKTIRTRITPIASSAFIAHLPKEFKKEYLHNMHREFAIKFDYDAFIEDLYALNRDVFHSKDEAERTVSAVFKVLKRYITEAQYGAMISLMPLVLRINLRTETAFEMPNYYFIN
jgi:uncharacterized protein (DUF2267 family)